jgi:glycosyltransferase involved in cell wall biosynthesis
MAELFNPCLIIPVYNHEIPLVDIVSHLAAYQLPCLLIDDGSCESCAKTIRQLAEQYAWVQSVRLEVNCGKGGAVKTGLRWAHTQGYSHAIQIDADGQHDLTDLERFISVARQQPDAAVIGQPLFDHSIPKIRLYARYLTHIWVYINTLSLQISDAMCGYRVYPVAACIQLMQHRRLEERMAFDVEILVRLYWQGVRIVSIPTHVSYPKDGISHFRSWEDNWRISLTHARLFCGMLLRFPALLIRHFR